MGALNDVGIPPNIRERLALVEKALAGDILWVCNPATVTGVSGAHALSRTVVVTLETAAGEVHDWFSKAIATGVSIADDATTGVATIPSTTLTIKNGRGTVVVSGTSAAWAGTETDTLTVAQATILGYTVAAKTSVETFA